MGCQRAALNPFPRPPYRAGYRISGPGLLDLSKKFGIYQNFGGDAVNAWFYVKRKNMWMRDCLFMVMDEEVMHKGHLLRYLVVTQTSKTNPNLEETQSDVEIKKSLTSVGIPVREWIVLDNPTFMRQVDLILELLVV